MLKLFSTESTVVPNGYIYTSHTGAKYVFLEGMWFNDSNMMMVDPQKYPNMYACARQQIVEHNNKSNTAFKIGENYLHNGKECTFIGESRFHSDDGTILSESEVITELMGDEQRVYQVSKETLQKEWSTLKFYILPPHAQDISIPAGIVVQGYKFIPNSHRFVELKSGRPVSPEMTRKLSEEGLRIARQLSTNNKLIPLKSVLIQGNVRSEWNGKEFCDNDGNVVVSEQGSKAIFQAYSQFVKANPEDFPSLTGASTGEEQRFGSVPKPEKVTEAEDEPAVGVPDGYRFTSGKNKTYAKQRGAWFDVETKKQLNSGAAQSIERAAQQAILKHNESGAMKIGTKVTSKKGKEYVYVGGDRFIGPDGKMIPKSAAQAILDRFESSKSENEPKPNDAPQEEPKAQEEPKPEAQAEPKEEPKEEPKPEPTPEPEVEQGNGMEALASQIKSSPYAKKITVLLTRGDKVSLLAADILLAGNKDEVVQILKSLNNNDE
ncbi:hypothetical protein ABV23_RS01955 [Escherichia coli]|nr:hypothetical protein [Escherichia coli]